MLPGRTGPLAMDNGEQADAGIISSTKPGGIYGRPAIHQYRHSCL